MIQRLACLPLSLLALALAVGLAQGAEAQPLAQGGCIYVPVYSEILIGDNSRPFPLSITLCLRNTCLQEGVNILAVDYFDSQGKLLKKYLDSPRLLPVLGTLTFTVIESEEQGGPGAKFIVRWRGPQAACAPLAEAVMIGTRNQQGISFTSRGLAIPDRQP